MLRILAVLVLILGANPPQSLAQSSTLREAIAGYQSLVAAGDFVTAEKGARASLETAEQELGANHVVTIFVTRDLANILTQLKRYDDAEALVQRALRHLDSAPASNLNQAMMRRSLASTRMARGHYLLAEPELRHALDILGDLPDVDRNLVDETQMLYSELQLMLGQNPGAARRLEELVGGEAGGRLAPDLNVRANIMRGQAYIGAGRYDSADTILTRTLKFLEDSGNQAHRLVVQTRLALGELDLARYRLPDAVAHFEAARAGAGRIDGLYSQLYGDGLYGLGRAKARLGRYDDARSSLGLAKKVGETIHDADHPFTGLTLVGLADLYTAQGNLDRGLVHYADALEIFQKTVGLDHPGAASVFAGMGSIFARQGDHEQAERFYLRALQTWTRAYGLHYPGMVPAILGVADLFREDGRLAEAMQYEQHALDVVGATFPPDHFVKARVLASRSKSLAEQGDVDAAAADAEAAVSVLERHLGQDHPDVTGIRARLSALYQSMDRPGLALEASRKSLVVHDAGHRFEDAETFQSLRQSLEESEGNAANNHTKVRRHLDLLAAALSKRLIEEDAVISDGFTVAQSVHINVVSAAIKRSAIRFAAGSGELSTLIRKRQDALVQWKRLEEALFFETAVGNEPVIEALRTELELNALIVDSASAKLRKGFPEFFEFVRPQPVPVDDLQAMLKPDEAMLMYVINEKQGHLWIIRQSGIDYHLAAISDDGLDRSVRALREALDPSLSAKRLRPYPAARAYQLYQLLIAPVEPMLAGIKHLIVVPDGALRSIPLGILLTEPPARPLLRSPDEMAAAPWLARKFAISVYPAVSSVTMLRRSGQKHRSVTRPFAGFGDPNLGPPSDSLRGLRASRLFRDGEVQSADVDAIRKLPSLPETRDELQSLATTLGADESDVYLSDAASEEAVKSVDLSDRRVVAFATHGLVAGEFGSVGEPALILTPPDQATARDDGLLTASEAALLKLNADWVILSACNTAAADGSPDARGLSGLARSFFYAGARAVLASHWPVETNAAAALTTRLFEYLAANPGATEAEALRNARLALMADATNTQFAHPLFWGPFVVVGGVGRSKH